MAVYYHTSSTGNNPQHFLGPPGHTLWCKFKRCEATCEIPPPQHTTTHPEIAPFVKAEFEKLSDPALMEWCVLGATQNESFNLMTWNRCLRTEFASHIVVEIAVDMAVIASNSDHEAWRGLLEQLKYGLGPTLLKFLDSKDELWVWMAEYKQKELVKKRRRQIDWTG